MTTFRNHVVFACLSVAATAGLVSFATPAAAAPMADARQATVVTADLNLAAPAGQATFERRLAAAARSVCAESATQNAAAESVCRREAVAQAHREAGLANVASN